MNTTTLQNQENQELKPPTGTHDSHTYTFKVVLNIFPPGRHSENNPVAVRLNTQRLAEISKTMTRSQAAQTREKRYLLVTPYIRITHNFTEYKPLSYLLLLWFKGFLAFERACGFRPGRFPEHQQTTLCGLVNQ